MSEKNLLLSICPEDEELEAMFTVTKNENLYYDLDVVDHHALVGRKY